MASRVMPASGTGQQALFAEQAVDERGFSGVRAADDGQGEGAFFVGGFWRAVPPCGDSCSNGASRSYRSASPSPCSAEIAHRRAQSQGVRLGQRGFHGAHVFRLVDREHHRLAGLAQQRGEMAVRGRNARPAVHHQQRHVGRVHGFQRLRGHAGGEATAVGFFQARCVDGAEFQRADVGHSLPPVARDTRLVGHQRGLRAG